MTTPVKRVPIYRVTMRGTGDVFLITDGQRIAIENDQDEGKKFIRINSIDVQVRETINIQDIQSIRLDPVETSKATRTSIRAGMAITSSSNKIV